MGKNLIQQKRGKGSPSFRVPSHRYAGDAKHRLFSTELKKGRVIDMLNSIGHSAPLCRIRYEDGVEALTMAIEGIRVGDNVDYGSGSEIKAGNTLPLSEIPDGALISNVEAMPGDGGKFVRSSGTHAKILTRTPEGVVVALPSKKQRIFNGNCRATIGIISGGGRKEKPFYKAGRKFHAMKAKNRTWPIVSGAAMNAVSHPYGKKRTSRKGKPTIAPKNAPPGRKVGKIRPRRTGRKK